MFTLGSTLLGLAVASAPALAMNVSNVLIYSYTAGFRHDSIPTAVAEMTRRGPDYGINFVNTEDMTMFTDDYLSQFDALFFLSNTDEVLDAQGKVAFQNYLDKGGNFMGAHAASDCMLNFTTMERTLGSQFAYHPEFTNATMLVADPSHPSTAGLPPKWEIQDEIYNFNHDPRSLGAVVVLTADETSYTDDGDHSPGQGSPHPTAWYQERLKGSNSTGPVGRSFYTGLGHAAAAWKDDVFMSHVFGGVTYVLSSNTTRAMNPSATVGSLGPSWTPPPPAPTATVDIHSSAVRVLSGLSLIGSTLVLSSIWFLML
jgi:type 1 glutamine amidotransferase